MKLTTELYRAIHKMAKEQAWGKGIYCEVGRRSIGLGPGWDNRLDPRDEREGADLEDQVPLKDYKGQDLAEVDGRVLLDLWVHNSEELCTNVMVELDAQGIGAAYSPSYTDDSRFYTREGFTPHSEQHVSKEESRINWPV